MTIAAFVVAALRHCSTDYWPIADGIGQDLSGFLVFFLQAFQFYASA